MKKDYENPILEEEEIEIEDVIAASGTIGGKKPGDKEGSFFGLFNL